MFPHDARGRRVVNNDGAGTLGDAPQHGVIEVAAIGARCGSAAPEVTRHRAIPLAVVKYELVDVAALVELAQQEMVEHRVVQYDDTGFFQSSRVSPGVQ